MVKKCQLIVFILCLSIWSNLSAQILHPVKWSYGSMRMGKNEALLFFKATMDNGWHIYSVNQKDGGPVKTNFSFTPATNYRLIGNIQEPTPLAKFDKSFNMNVLYFGNSVVFQQKVSFRHIQDNKIIIKGTLNFMVCNDERCLPPEDVKFSILLK